MPDAEIPETPDEAAPAPPPAPPSWKAIIGYVFYLMIGGQLVFRGGGQPAALGFFGFSGFLLVGSCLQSRAFVRALLVGFLTYGFYGSVLRTNDPEYQAKAAARRAEYEAKRAAEQEQIFLKAANRRYAKADFKLDAKVVYDEFLADSEAALKKYEGKLVAVTGQVSEVVAEGETRRLSVLGVVEGQVTKVGVLFRSRDAKSLEGIQVGDQVEALGELSAYLFEVPAAVLDEVRKVK